MKYEENGKFDAIEEATGLCGCGTGEDFRLLLQALELCEMPVGSRSGKEGSMYQSPAMELAAKVLDKADLIEHGTGIGFPWLTDKGKEVLRQVREWKGE